MFFPLGDDNSARHRTPYVVFAIIALNAYVWWLQLRGGERFTNAFSVVPYELTRGVDLAQTLMLRTSRGELPLRHFAGPDPLALTVFSAMFMHGSWMHILGNMLYLWIFGDQIEDRLGHIRFLFFYLGCGVLATIAHVMGDVNSVIPSLGASGAIAGVLGAYLVLHPRNRVRVLFFRDVIILPAAIVLSGWIVLQIYGQMSAAGQRGGGVAYLAHIGGFIAGIALLPILMPRRRMF